MLGTVENHLGPSLDYMLDTLLLTWASATRKQPLLSGQPLYVD
jgi:hypothetical protein